MAGLYEKEAKNYFSDGWKARDGYIELILDRSAGSRKGFFKKYAKHSFSLEEEIRAMKLLEMERFAMLTETSCGWFFNDLSGIETVQILRYAARALELAKEFGGADVEKEFLEHLRRAKSNRPEIGEGAALWEKEVASSRVSPEKIVGHFAFRQFFELPVSTENFYGYEIKEEERETETSGDMALAMGSVVLTGKIIPESQKFVYAFFRKGVSGIQCFVKEQSDSHELQKLNVAPLADLRKRNAPLLAQHLSESFGSSPVLLRDLFPEERDEILRALSLQMRDDYYEAAIHFYKENKPWAELFHEAGRPVPDEFRSLVEWMMGERLLDWARKLVNGTSLEESVKGAKSVLEEAQAGKFSVKTEPAIQFLSVQLNTWMEELFRGSDGGLLGKINQVFHFAKEVQIGLHDRVAQELFFVFAQKILPEWMENSSKFNEIQAILRLGVQLGFNMERYENQLKAKT